VTLSAPMRKFKLVKGAYFTMLRVEGEHFQIVSESMEKMSPPSDFASPRFDLVLPQSPDLEGLGRLEEGIDVWCIPMRQEVVQAKRTFPGQDGPVPVALMDGLVLLPAQTDSGAFRRIGVWVTDYRGLLKEEESPFYGVAQ